MTTLLVRNVDARLHARLKARAAEHGRSMEEEVRVILRESLQATEPEAVKWVDAIRALVEPLGGIDLPTLPRSALREPPQFVKQGRRERARG